MFSLGWTIMWNANICNLTSFKQKNSVWSCSFSTLWLHGIRICWWRDVNVSPPWLQTQWQSCPHCSPSHPWTFSPNRLADKSALQSGDWTGRHKRNAEIACKFKRKLAAVFLMSCLLSYCVITSGFISILFPLFIVQCPWVLRKVPINKIYYYYYYYYYISIN